MCQLIIEDLLLLFTTINQQSFWPVRLTFKQLCVTCGILPPRHQTGCHSRPLGWTAMFSKPVSCAMLHAKKGRLWTMGEVLLVTQPVSTMYLYAWSCGSLIDSRHLFKNYLRCLVCFTFQAEGVSCAAYLSFCQPVHSCLQVRPFRIWVELTLYFTGDCWWLLVIGKRMEIRTVDTCCICVCPGLVWYQDGQAAASWTYAFVPVQNGTRTVGKKHLGMKRLHVFVYHAEYIRILKSMDK